MSPRKDHQSSSFAGPDAHGFQRHVHGALGSVAPGMIRSVQVEDVGECDAHEHVAAVRGRRQPTT